MLCIELKAEVDVHHKTMGSVSGPCGMTFRTDRDGANVALDSVFASVPESAIMDVYNSVS